MATAPSRWNLAAKAVAAFPELHDMEVDVEEDHFHYVLDAVCAPDGKRCAVAVSDCSIKVYDNSTLKLIHSFKGHAGKVNEITWTNHIVSSSADETIRVWDARQKKCCKSFKAPEAVNSHSVGLDESLLAVGTEKRACFFDFGTGKSLEQYDEFLEEDNAVTRIRCHPSSPAQVVTGSEDGLICVFDLSISGEDEACIGIMNAECCVDQLGFFGPGFQGVFCTTTIHSVLVFDLTSSEQLFGLPDLRKTLSPVFQAPIDYCLNCLPIPGSSALRLVAGSHSGDVGVFEVNPGAVTLQQRLSGAHSKTVHCCCSAPNGLITGGEDGLVSRWSSGAPAPAVSDSQTGKAKKKRNRHAMTPI